MSKKISNNTISKIACFVAGCALATGVAMSHTNSAQDAVDHVAAKPTVVPKTVTVPKTVEVPTVPQTCIDALAAADTAIATAGEGFGILSDALTAAGDFDAAGIEAASTRLATLNTDRLTPALAAYQAARDTCKAAQR